MKFNFKGKTALITGGTHGIGLSCAEQLLKLGAKVITFSRDIKKIRQSKIKFKKYKNNFYVSKGDVLDENFLLDFSKLLIKKFKNIDILIHNVGGGGRWGKPNVDKTEMNVWEEVYEKNNNGVILFNKIFVKLMKKKNWGRVIAIGSTNGSEVNFGDRPWFTAAKAAQVAIIKNYSKIKQFTNSGITFNTISPGPIDIKGTGWDQKNNNKMNLWVKENIPLNRLGKPEEVANLAIFLASDFASYINGCNIKIDGGKSNSI